LREVLRVSDVVHYTFCPIFAYFDCILELKQHEENRGTVIAGRKLHKKHEIQNKSCLPSDLQGKKYLGLQLYSQKYDFIGKIYEAIEVDKEIILIERKYTDKVIVGETMLVQIGLLAILLKENLKKPVKSCIVIFQKDKRHIMRVQIEDSTISLVLKKLEEIKKNVCNASCSNF
jgi:CRISPR-associated exonuclease Cas4